MKNCFLLLYALLAMGAPRVAAQGVDYTFDKHVNFYNYKTYQWVNINNGQRLDDLTADQLLATLDVELAKKGLEKSQSDPPDLYIGYQIARNNDRHFAQYNVGASSGSAAGANSGTAGTTITTVHSGQLVLDMYDSSKKQLVWRGVVANAIDADATPAKKQKHLDKTIERLLKNYPPKKT
jgi:uncharacterized protein DUF4136